MSGAAISALIGNFCLVLFSFLVVPKIAKVSYGFIIKTLFQVLLSVLLMGIAVWYTNFHFHYLVAIVVGGIVYTLALFVFRVVTRAQLKEAYLLINKKSSSS